MCKIIQFKKRLINLELQIIVQLIDAIGKHAMFYKLNTATEWQFLGFVEENCYE